MMTARQVSKRCAYVPTCNSSRARALLLSAR
jgi:hypothetical protein